GYPGYGGFTPNSSSPSQLTNVSGTLFFMTNSGLWRSDGTDAGTVHLGSGGSQLTAVGDTLFFAGGGGSWGSGVELWQSDGTVAGTTQVKDINPGGGWVYYSNGYGYGGSWEYVPNSSNPGSLTNVNGTLFFSANGGYSGVELWKSDGTEAGTVQVKEINQN